MKEATVEDAMTLAQKLNLNKELVWDIIGGKRFGSLTDMAMAIQESFAVPVGSHIWRGNPSGRA